MKRFYAALALLALLGAFCAVGCLKTDEITDVLEAGLDRVEQYAEMGQYPGAKSEMQALCAYYREKEHILAVYMSRVQTAAVAVSLATVETYLDAEHSQDLGAEMERARAQIYALRHLFFSLF